MPQHLVRATPNAGKTSRRKPPAAPVKEYPPGYFTPTWPPGWEPSSEGLKTANDYHLDEARKVAMQRRVGFAAGGGTIVLQSGTPKIGRPRNTRGY